MSKKQNQKKKVTVKLLPGQAVYVTDADVLKHIAETYLAMAQQCENDVEKESWLNVAQEIFDWSAKTLYKEEDDYEEEW